VNELGSNRDIKLLMVRVDRWISPLRRLLSVLLQVGKTRIPAIVCLKLVEGIFPISTSWAIKLLLDKLSATQGNPYGRAGINHVSLITPLIALGIISVAQAISSFINQFMSNELGRGLSRHIRSEVYKKLINFRGISYFESPKLHNDIQLAVQGSTSVTSGIISTLGGIIKSAITLFSYVGIFLMLSPILAIFVILSSVPHLITHLRISDRRLAIRERMIVDLRQMNYYGQLLSDPMNVKEIRLFNLGDHFRCKWLSVYDSVHETQRDQEIKESVAQFALGIVGTLVYILSYFFVALKVYSGSLSIGDIGFYASATTSIQAGLNGLIFGISSLKEIVRSMVYYDRLMKLPQPIHVPKRSKAIANGRCEIRFENVSFRYGPEQQWVLRNLDLHIPSGKCLALVGHNGSGKSTIVKLLLRFYDPTEGDIYWNDLNVRDIDPVILRARISAVFQDFARYQLSIRENIALGNLRLANNQNSIQRAAQLAGIHERIESLPGGYETIMSRALGNEDEGIDLSCGEWQKIAMARMLMRNPDLLLLDEPTAALDPSAEHSFLSQFPSIISNRTTLIISHRLTDVKIADAIAVLHGGRIVEYGTHKELLQRNKLYMSLYRLRGRRYSAEQSISL
jgi:ATP-binding cassette subfamily B protein